MSCAEKPHQARLLPRAHGAAAWRAPGPEISIRVESEAWLANVRDFAIAAFHAGISKK